MKLFDGFVVGELLGEHSLLLGENEMTEWEWLFPGTVLGGTAPPGFVAVVTMRSFLSIVTPRPPGNVHGSQRFDLHRLPKVGEMLATRITCVGKEIKHERKWVDFSTETVGQGGELCFEGRMSIAWAA
jgi:acyl dehydratase